MPKIKTLDNLDQWLINNKEMPSNRRYERRAAIRDAVDWFETGSDRISAGSRELRERFEPLSPGALGVTRRRISNAKSALLAAVRAAGILPKYKHVDTFLPEYVSLWEKLTVPEKRQLSRLLRFYSARKILPEEFDNAIGQKFLAHLEEETLARSPRTVHQNACRRWNGLCECIPDFFWESSVNTK